MVEIKDTFGLMRLLETPKYKLKATGDARTNPTLVNEILDQLPKSVWKKGGQFLDPCCGKGTFLLAVIERLKKYHSNDEIVKMIHGVDIDSWNVYTTKILLSNNLGVHESVINIEKNDSIRKVWKMKFDVVVGNPPFQAVNNDGERADAGSNLWMAFVNKAMSELLHKDGFLAFVTPDTWSTPYSEDTSGGRKNGRELRKLFRTKQIIYLNYRECGRHFSKVGSAFSSYIIKNVDSVGPTTVKFINATNEVVSESINLKGFYWFPTTPDTIMWTILNKVFWSTENYNFLEGCSPASEFSKEKNKEYKYPCYQAATTIRYTNKKHKYQTTKKIVIPSLSTKNLAIYDPGVYGPVLNGANIEVSNDSEGANFLSFFNSTVIQYCLSQSRWHHAYQMTYVIKCLPKIDLTRSWTDKELYNYFKLTKEEIKYIESNVK